MSHFISKFCTITFEVFSLVSLYSEIGHGFLLVVKAPFNVIKAALLRDNVTVSTLVSLLSLFLLCFYEMFRRRLDFLHPRRPGKTINV